MEPQKEEQDAFRRRKSSQSKHQHQADPSESRYPGGRSGDQATGHGGPQVAAEIPSNTNENENELDTEVVPLSHYLAPTSSPSNTGSFFHSIDENPEWIALQTLTGLQLVNQLLNMTFCDSTVTEWLLELENAPPLTVNRDTFTQGLMTGYMVFPNNQLPLSAKVPSTSRLSGDPPTPIHPAGSSSNISNDWPGDQADASSQAMIDISLSEGSLLKSVIVKHALVRNRYILGSVFDESPHLFYSAEVDNGSAPKLRRCYMDLKWKGGIRMVVLNKLANGHVIIIHQVFPNYGGFAGHVILLKNPKPKDIRNFISNNLFLRLGILNESVSCQYCLFRGNVACQCSQSMRFRAHPSADEEILTWDHWENEMVKLRNRVAHTTFLIYGENFRLISESSLKTVVTCQKGVNADMITRYLTALYPLDLSKVRRMTAELSNPRSSRSSDLRVLTGTQLQHESIERERERERERGREREREREREGQRLSVSFLVGQNETIQFAEQDVRTMGDMGLESILNSELTSEQTAKRVFGDEAGLPRNVRMRYEFPQHKQSDLGGTKANMGQHSQENELLNRAAELNYNELSPLLPPLRALTPTEPSAPILPRLPKLPNLGFDIMDANPSVDGAQQQQKQQQQQLLQGMQSAMLGSLAEPKSNPVGVAETRPASSPSGSVHQPDGSSSGDEDLEPKTSPDTKATSSRAADTPSRMFVCSYCAARFSRKYHLDRHIKAKHLGERPYVCHVCGKSFQQRSHCDSHITVVHDNLRLFVCNICGHAFGTQSNLTKHMNFVHDGNSVSPSASNRNGDGEPPPQSTPPPTSETGDGGPSGYREK
mmetsp:Transcript_14982/g.26018  ORF Transcript_14982/g.26018 Transcript_14982/m.26018 type:complete len:826 (+) Transcript_14982:295-2772(+)